MNKIKVKIYSAVELDTEQKSLIEKKLADLLKGKKKELSIKFSVEADLIGGLLVEIDEKVIDLSIKGELDKLERLIS